MITKLCVLLLLSFTVKGATRQVWVEELKDHRILFHFLGLGGQPTTEASRIRMLLMISQMVQIEAPKDLKSGSVYNCGDAKDICVIFERQSGSTLSKQSLTEKVLKELNQDSTKYEEVSQPNSKIAWERNRSLPFFIQI